MEPETVRNIDWSGFEGKNSQRDTVNLRCTSMYKKNRSFYMKLIKAICWLRVRFEKSGAIFGNVLSLI